MYAFFFFFNMLKNKMKLIYLASYIALDTPLTICTLNMTLIPIFLPTMKDNCGINTQHFKCNKIKRNIATKLFYF